MFKLLNKKKNNKGFTLVELVIVVAILAILVGILAPQYTKYVERSRKSADASNLDNLVTAVKVAAADGSKDVVDSTEQTYTLKITSTVTTLTGGSKNDDVKAAITEYAGDAWESTTLKSKAWGTTDGSITATIKIAANGSVTVEYDPTDVQNKVKED